MAEVTIHFTDGTVHTFRKVRPVWWKVSEDPRSPFYEMESLDGGGVTKIPLQQIRVIEER